MTSPQTEDGFTRIANELLESFISYRLSGEEMQVVLFIIRKTYGYKKKSDYIALSQFVEATGIQKSNVARAIRNLIAKNVVVKKDNELSVNKDRGTWKPLSKKITTVVKTDNDIVNIDKASLSILSTTKETTTKDNFTKETSTNVLEGFGKPSLNRGMLLLKQTGGGTKTQLNRFALNRLINKHGEERTLQAYKFGVSIRGKPYAPMIKNFLDLEEKWVSLEAYVQRQQAEIGGNVYDATTIS